MSLRAYIGKDWDEIQRLYGHYLLPIILVLSGFLLLRRLSRPKRNLPSGPICLPLVGYLPFLGKEPFRVLDSLSKKYGNVFSLYLGRTYVVILGDFSAVKETYTQTAAIDKSPRVFDFLPDGVGVSSVNGEEWVEQRRFTVRSMKDIGLGRSTWANLVEEEISEFLTLIESEKGAPIDIYKPLTSSISNNISSLVFGKRLPPGPERDFLDSSLDNVMLFFSQASLWNYFPWLCDIFVKLKITSYYKSSCEMSAFNDFIRKEIDRHRKTQSDLKDTDFIHDYMKTMETFHEEGKKTSFNEKNLIGNTQALFLAGSDTTRTSLMWLFVAMAAYPDVQKKVHFELDSVLGKKQRASWEDRSKFPYIYAVIMEAQRWKTLAPLNTSRVASEDIKICGYDIPKGSTIIANNWGIHNDLRYWSDPEEFIPERFLLNDGKGVNLKPESYVPFSYGKRRCPGDIVALMEIFLYFTALMQLFEIRAPNGGKPNMDALLGLTYQPVAQELCFVPREETSEQM